MKLFLPLIVFGSFFLQGCGLAGAYIWFGDRYMNAYNHSKSTNDKVGMQEALSRALGSYKDSLTYDDTRYPLVYAKLADTQFIMTPNDPKNSLGYLAAGLEKCKEDPSNPDRITEIATLLATQGKYFFLTAKDPFNAELMQKAKDSYRGALIHKPVHPEFNAGLMKILFFEIEKNRFEAQEIRNRLLFSEIDDLMDAGLDPAKPSPYIVEAQGILAFIKGDYATAIAKLSEVIEKKINFDQRKTYYYLARSFTETKKFAEAIQISSSWLEEHPEDLEFYGERCLAGYLKGDIPSGNQDLEKLEAAIPDFHEFFYRVGVVFSSQGLTNRSEVYLVKAYRLYPENPNYAYALGKNYLLKGEKITAKQFFEKSANVAPSGSEIEKAARQAVSEL